ncbi:MAG: MFS transporter, partial [Alphaproteobacteria bacterium]|nr:MFS transporter [Alphaproteobacteria bacterium]
MTTSVNVGSSHRPIDKGVRGWMFFDWAAQPFFTVVTTFIFGPYFVARMTDDPVSAQTA